MVTSRMSMILGAAALALASALVIMPMQKMEAHDCAALKGHFQKNIRETNDTACMKYLSHYMTKPTWRNALTCALIISGLTLLAVQMCVSRVTPRQSMMIYLVVLLFSSLVLYLMKNNENWHCFCNDSCGAHKYLPTPGGANPKHIMWSMSLGFGLIGGTFLLVAWSSSGRLSFPLGE